MNKNFFLVFILVFLVVTALVLGFVIMKPKPNYTNNNSNNPSQSPSNNQPSKNLTDDEKKVMLVPAPGSDASAFSAHFDLATKLAVSSPELEVGDCMIKPVVIKVKDGSELIIKNSSKEDRLLSFDKDNVVSVSAGKTHKMKVDFKNGPGLYGYGCDMPDIQKTAGFVLVEPKE